METMRCIFLALCLSLFAARAARGDITPDNAFEFLRTAELKATINVSVDNIDWIEDEAAAAEHGRQLEAALARNPDDLEAASELIELYLRGCRREEAVAVALRTLPAYKERWNREQSEAAALSFARAALASADRQEQIAGYRALQPYLESGRAGRETCVATMELCKRVNAFQVAELIADTYLPVYPRFAELYYQRYAASLTGNMYARLSEAVQASTREALDEEDLRELIARVFIDLADSVDTASLEKAVALEPGNYKYALNTALYETVTAFFLKVFLEALSGVTVDERPANLLRQAAVVLPPRLHAPIQAAEALRPARDIQVYLVGAMAGIVLENYAEAEAYAHLAIETRPDRPEGYEALILAIFGPFVVSDNDIPPAAVERGIARYEDKIRRTRASASDYASLANLLLVQLIDAEPAARGPLLAKARLYAEKARDSDPGFVPGRLVLANVHIASRDYRRAIVVLEDIPVPEDPDLAAMRLHNLGIARILAGERGAGIASLRAALELQPDNPESLDALSELVGE